MNRQSAGRNGLAEIEQHDFTALVRLDRKAGFIADGESVARAQGGFSGLGFTAERLQPGMLAGRQAMFDRLAGIQRSEIDPGVLLDFKRVIMAVRRGDKSESIAPFVLGENSLRIPGSQPFRTRQARWKKN